MSGYGASKALLTALTMAQAKAYPNLRCYSLSPGWIQTKMTAGSAASRTPEEGCVAYLRVLFEPGAVSGWFYGSDGLRSPITMSRDPGTNEYVYMRSLNTNPNPNAGTKEYVGEPEPEIDPADYNK